MWSYKVTKVKKFCNIIKFGTLSSKILRVSQTFDLNRTINSVIYWVTSQLMGLISKKYLVYVSLTDTTN